MPKKNETKHDAFRRLAEVRIPRALEELRLVGQLSTRSYENTDEEAEAVVSTLVEAVKAVADQYDVPMSIATGEDARVAERTGHLVTSNKNTGEINAIDIAMAIQAIQKGQLDAGLGILRKTLA